VTYSIDLADPAVRKEVLEQLNGNVGELGKKLELSITDVAPGRIEAIMPALGNRQPYGLLHGGASCALAETLGSVAAGLHAGPGRVPVGVDINATHHRAVTAGTVTGVGTPVHRGRTLVVFEIVISDESGRRVCTSRITCMLLDR